MCVCVCVCVCVCAAPSFIQKDFVSKDYIFHVCFSPIEFYSTLAPQNLSKSIWLIEPNAVFSDRRASLFHKTLDWPICYAMKIDIKLRRQLHEQFKLIPNITRAWWHLVLVHFPEIDGKCQFFPLAVLPVSAKVEVDVAGQTNQSLQEKNKWVNEQGGLPPKYVHPGKDVG